jgi:hypothetical protein
VTTLLHAPGPDWVEEAPVEGLEVSVGTGYAESKRVAEEVRSCSVLLSSSLLSTDDN